MPRSDCPTLAADLVARFDSAVPAGAPPAVLVVRAGGPPAPAPRRLDQLAGWTADPDVTGLGIVSTGTARRLPGAAAPGRAAAPDWGTVLDAAPGTTRVVVAATRDGAVACRLRRNGRVVHDEPTGGRLHDTLLRCLGAPTAAPPPAAVLLHLLWLGAIADDTAGDPVGWPEAVSLHPLADELPPAVALGELEAAVAGPGPDDTWERLRRSHAAGRMPTSPVSPAVAAWTDEGAFARMLLGELPPLGAALVRAGVHLTPEAFDRVVAVVEPWLVPADEACW